MRSTTDCEMIRGPELSMILCGSHSHEILLASVLILHSEIKQDSIMSSKEMCMQ